MTRPDALADGLGRDWFDYALDARPRIAGTLRLNLTEAAAAHAREEATQLGHPDDEWMAALPPKTGKRGAHDER